MDDVDKRKTSIHDVTSGVVIRPGDTLVLGMSAFVTDAEAAALKEEIETHLPGVRAAIIEGAQLLVYRPAPDPVDTKPARGQLDSYGG